MASQLLSETACTTQVTLLCSSVTSKQQHILDQVVGFASQHDFTNIGTG